MKTLLFTSFLVVPGLLATSTIANAADAQQKTKETPPRNAVHLEIGGPGILYSVNYERFFLPQLSVRLGISLFGLRENGSGDTLGALPIPITAQYLVGKGSHHLELGLGLMTGVLWSDLNSYAKTETFGLIAATATIGYRYQPARRGWLFRAALTPIYGGSRFDPLGLPITPWVAIGAGYSF